MLGTGFWAAGCWRCKSSNTVVYQFNRSTASSSQKNFYMYTEDEVKDCQHHQTPTRLYSCVYDPIISQCAFTFWSLFFLSVSPRPVTEMPVKTNKRAAAAQEAENTRTLIPLTNTRARPTQRPATRGRESSGEQTTWRKWAAQLLLWGQTAQCLWRTWRCRPGKSPCLPSCWMSMRSQTMSSLCLSETRDTSPRQRSLVTPSFPSSSCPRLSRRRSDRRRLTHPGGCLWMGRTGVTLRVPTLTWVCAVITPWSTCLGTTQWPSVSGQARGCHQRRSGRWRVEPARRTGCSHGATSGCQGTNITPTSGPATSRSSTQRRMVSVEQTLSPASPPASSATRIWSVTCGSGRRTGGLRRGWTRWRRAGASCATKTTATGTAALRGLKTRRTLARITWASDVLKIFNLCEIIWKDV